MMKSGFNKYLLSVCSILSCTTALAILNDPPVPGDVVPNPGLPIDGGLGFLLISGVIYGIYELKRRK